MATSVFARLPGFRDFPPEDFALRTHICEAWRRVSRRYGFLEYDGPPLEPIELYVQKSGGEIVDQLYSFVDKGNREVSLRPEMTPSLARILGARSRGMSKPIRWFSLPQLFRYERQQRGRLKEHFQWNVDVVGEAGLAADAEILAVAIDGLRELGLTSEDFVARVSDRGLVQMLLGTLGVPEDAVAAALAVADKLGRTPEVSVRERLVADMGFPDDLAERILEVFLAPSLEDLDAQLCSNRQVSERIESFREFLARLDAMGLGEYVEVDLKIVRGLAYYTGVVFELFDRKGELRAICGGGRYDKLLELVGGEPLPATGFGMGDVVLGELLADRGLVPTFRRELDYFVVAVSPEERPEALRIAQTLRESGKSVAYSLREQSVVKQMKAAGREGASVVLILGPDELERGCLVARDMTSGEEREVVLSDLM
ncbi:MAG TPA: histidine--tRNA ligase [Gemmatimonadetes bacterium]|nr:histidine--tRNA ligase [Gemmatimonadota bacterium]